jgi:hypothetical protein
MNKTQKLLGLRLGVPPSVSASKHLSDASTLFSKSRSFPLSITFSIASFTLGSNGDPLGNTCGIINPRNQMRVFNHEYLLLNG